MLKNKMEKFFVFTCSCVLTAVATGGDLNKVEVDGLTSVCATCHGLPSGERESMSLYGYDEKLFFEKFKSFQTYSGENPGVMYYISKGYSDEEIREMARQKAKKY